LSEDKGKHFTVVSTRMIFFGHDFPVRNPSINSIRDVGKNTEFNTKNMFKNLSLFLDLLKNFTYIK